MPRTKLDKRIITRAQLEERVIRSAMARNGIFTNKALAEAISSDAGYLSKGFKTGFSHRMKLRMNKILRFTQEEIEVIGDWNA